MGDRFFTAFLSVGSGLLDENASADEVCIFD